MNENFKSLKVHVNGPLPKRSGCKPEYPEKNPDNQSENRCDPTSRNESHGYFVQVVDIAAQYITLNFHPNDARITQIGPLF